MLTIVDKPYLIFSLNGALYGVEAECVQEIFSLPELKPIAEAPPDIVGVVNLRGDILLIVDLNLRFGYKQLEYNLSDSAIVLEWQKLRIGIIVNQVHEVCNILPEDISKELFYSREVAGKSHSFISGIAKVAADIVMLLNTKNLLHYSELFAASAVHKTVELDGDEDRVATNYRHQPYIFCPHATPEEKAIFRERSENLMRPTEKQDFAGLIALAVVGLNGEYFGLDLKLVREFTESRKVTPVPCCPPHIIGNMNLRGEIVTLVDIRGVLNMPMLNIEIVTKVMVICVDDFVAGVIVDEVFDVAYLHPSQLSSVPTAIHSINNEYLQGTAPYREKMMSILDLQKIFTKGELIVNEEV
ncbi:chemotaxis protein CheW [Aerosakkonema funiforme]|uniref:chemotaxis protein CheW n=1 Tax=Aerosakkonema funiforme TaxID=1246630 RepID=UPI0035B9A305